MVASRARANLDDELRSCCGVYIGWAAIESHIRQSGFPFVPDINQGGIGTSMNTKANPINRSSQCGLARTGIGAIGGLSAAGLALALGWTGGCDPEPVPDPPCAFQSEVEIAQGEFIREPGNPWHHATITTEAGDYVLEFQLDEMPAAEVRIDGEKLNLAAGVSVRDEVTLRFELSLSAGPHEVSLRVAGPPGGRLRYRLARVINSEQPAIIDNFTVHQGQASVHSLCGGTSSISFASDALQPDDEALDVTVHCEAAACVEGGASLASARLVFDTSTGGYQFRASPELDHPASRGSVRELDGVPIASQEVGMVTIDGAEAPILRSRIPHFSTVEDRDLAPWCEQQLTSLGAPASYLCYPSADSPGLQYLALCEMSEEATTASNIQSCGQGPDACTWVPGADDECNPSALDCEARARGALAMDPCPALPDDSSGSPSHALRCDEFTNQVFVGVANNETGECELRGQSLLTRDEQVKTVLAATYGARFEEGIEYYLATNPACAMRDFSSEFVDYPAWENIWSTDILKFAICVDILRGRGDPGDLSIAPQERVLEAEMAAMMVRAGGVGPLGLPDGSELEPHSRAVELHQRHAALLSGTTLPLVQLDNQDCPEEAWFFADPVVQAVTDEGVVCGVDALKWMTREDTAQWLYNLTMAPVTCEQAAVSCEDPSGYPEPMACDWCSTMVGCQEMVNSLIALFPDYAAGNKQITFTTFPHPKEYCYRSGDWVYCSNTIFGNGKITNKLLFHELNHALNNDASIDSSGGVGICSNGGCNSREFQASVLEGYYFPASESECLGGHYRFTDSNNSSGSTRTVEDLTATFQQSPAVPVEALWDYAMGREDRLVPYLERFGVTETADLYHSQTYEW